MVATDAPDPWGLFRAAPAAMVVLDSAGRPDWWNDAFDDLFRGLQPDLVDRPASVCDWCLGDSHPEIVRLLAARGGRADHVDFSTAIFEVSVGYHDGRAIVVMRNQTEAFNRHAFDEVSTAQMRQAAGKVGDISKVLAEELPTIEDNASQTSRTAVLVQDAAAALNQRLEGLVARTLTVTEVTDEAVVNSRTAHAQVDRDADRTRVELQKAAEEAKAMSAGAHAIGDIAQQTRILALNISIGAARVGSVGQEFSVIAREVRALAGRTEQIADQIHDSTRVLIESLPEALAALSGLRAHTSDHRAAIEKLSDAVDEQKGEVMKVQAQLAADDREGSIRKLLDGVSEASEATLAIVQRTRHRMDGLHAVLDDVERAVARCDGEPSLTPADVYRMTRVAHHLVTACLGRPFDRTARTFAGKKPQHVLERLNDCTDLLQDRLGLALSFAPPQSRITPTQVFIRARDLVEGLKHKLQSSGCALPDAVIQEPPYRNKTPNDVFGQVDLLHDRLGAS